MTTTQNSPQDKPVEGQPMGDMIMLSGGGIEITPFAGLTAAKVAALVKKQVG